MASTSRTTPRPSSSTPRAAAWSCTPPWKSPGRPPWSSGCTASPSLSATRGKVIWPPPFALLANDTSDPYQCSNSMVFRCFLRMMI